MTKTNARKLVKAVLRRGHFRPGVGKDPIPGTGSLLYAYCPTCNEKVQYDGLAWDTNSKLEQGLREALVDHLAEEH